jgi:hypothetical protein
VLKKKPIAKIGFFLCQPIGASTLISVERIDLIGGKEADVDIRG